MAAIRLTSKYNFDTAYYLYDLTRNRECTFNDHTVMPASSIRKISIMLAALSLIRRGSVRPDELYKMQHKQVKRSESIGIIQYLRPGFLLTFQDLVTLMMISGDNVAGQIIVDRIGLEYINEYCLAIGLTNTQHRTAAPVPGIKFDHPIWQLNITSANDTGTLLRKILLGAKQSSVANEILLTPSLCRLALNIMRWQQGFSEFPILLPENASLAHKHGWGVRNCGDAGIFFKGDTPKFILVTLVDNVVGKNRKGLSKFVDAVIVIAELARLAWNEYGR